jgi:phospholipid/cholesterol/gamma-HCH transport system substrate-binding protein
MSGWKDHVAQGEDHTAKLRHRRNKVTTAAAVKLGIFTAISVMVTALLTVIMGNIGLGSEKEYHAIFTNASMLQSGDDVRIAGVNVGEVKSVDHYERTMAEVTFKVDSDVQLTDASTAEIRYLNLVGDRYMSLEEGKPGSDAKPLEDGGTIDVSNTKPALDLTVLFDGFKPLFQALTPDQVNELSMNLVQVLQGEGGTVQSLLEHTASLTTSLADRDKLIGEVVNNLGETLKTVDQHHVQLTSLVVQLKNWMQDLARDRETIGGSLDHISDLTVTVADLLHRGRPLLKSDIAALHDLAKLLNEPKQRAAVEDLLKRMPEVMSDQLRTGTYGSWYQYYICAVNARIKLPIISGLNLPLLNQISDAIENFNFHSTAPRCQDK